MIQLDYECTLEKYWPIGKKKMYQCVFGPEIDLSQLSAEYYIPDLPDPSREDVAGAIMSELFYVGAYFGAWHLDFCDRQQGIYGRMMLVLKRETQASQYKYLFKAMVEKYDVQELLAIFELITDEFENLC